MSTEEDYQQDDINEDLIYQQMFEAISEEIHVEEGSGEETPNLDSLVLTKQQIAQIRKGGIEVFKEIMQSRFRENIEQEYQSEQQGGSVSQSTHQGEQQIQKQGSIVLDTQIEAVKKEDIKPQMEVEKEVKQEEVKVNSTVKEVQESEKQNNHIVIENYEAHNSSNSPPHQSPKKQVENDNIFQQQQQEYLDVKINSTNIDKQRELSHEEKPVQSQIPNNPEDVNQHQEKSLELPLEENQNYQSYTHQRESSYDQNQRSINIDSENISPIAKRDRQREEEFSNPSKQHSLSAQNSAQKESNTKTASTNSNEKKQSLKANKIINDIFSLSGVKIGQFKSMTPMGYNSVNLSNSNINSRKDYNQSAMTQYQTTSIHSIKPLDNEDTVSRLYRKHQDVQLKIQKLKEDKISQELSTLKPKTEITKVSQKILSKSNYQKPSQISQIQYKEQIEKRQQLLEEKQKEKIEQELSGCTFHPQVLQKNNDDSQFRSISEFYDQQQKWLQAKDKNILSSQIDSIQRELSETTFHPKINKSSQSIIRNIKVEEKLIQDKEKVIEKRKKMVEETIPLFKPVILPKSQELAKKRREKDYTPCFEIQSKFN